MRKSKYNYRITSRREGSHLEPQTFTILLSGALEAAERHAIELPGCVTRIEQQTDNGWKLWHEGQWQPKRGCGRLVHVEGTNGGKMPCGGNLTELDGTTKPYFCSVDCETLTA
jgi:hypothetical protein